MRYKITILLFLLTISNLFLICLSPSTLVSAKLKGLSFSRGEKYFGLLQQWYFYAKNNQWAEAKKIENHLDPADTIVYKSNHHPDFINQKLADFYQKKDKTVFDWIQIAKLEAEISHFDLSLTAIKTAKDLDPVNQDLSNLYFTLSSLPL